MILLVWDLLIWILLALGVAFGGLGFFGLLIFPDIRSRMFTAIRATLISVTALTLAVILYGINGFLVTGDNQYVTLIIHTLFLYGVVVVADVSIARIIHEKSRDETCRPAPSGSGPEPEPPKVT
jgi:multicomponent Na+:H+ antiporter subunit G